MENKDNEEMNIKIQNKGKDGLSNAKGSCAQLANYINHEDEERLSNGKEALPYKTPSGLEVSTEEVINKIDRNHAHMSKKEDKFYHMVISPSQEEIKAMGSTEEEQYKSAAKYMTAISNAYAQNFNREEIKSGDDILLYWKPHFTRGDNDELQLHIHAIVSHRSKGREGRSIRLSPLSNNRHPSENKNNGGFDRDQFVRKSEKIFDKLFKYERQVAETYEYNNAMAHGSPEEKAEVVAKLEEEKKEELKEAITAGIEQRRDKIKRSTELDEINEILSMDNPEEIGGTKSAIEKTIEMAEYKKNIMKIFDDSKNMSELEFKLVCIGSTCKPITAENGGICDISFVKGGKQIMAADLTSNGEFVRMLNNWERITGQKSAQKVAEEQAKNEARKNSEKISQHTQKMGRKF